MLHLQHNVNSLIFRTKEEDKLFWLLIWRTLDFRLRFNDLHIYKY